VCILGAMAATSEAERARAMMAIQSVFDRYVTYFIAFYRRWSRDFHMIYGFYSVLSACDRKHLLL
jgi:hypothetical protein